MLAPNRRAALNVAALVALCRPRAGVCLRAGIPARAAAPSARAFTGHPDDGPRDFLAPGVPGFQYPTCGWSVLKILKFRCD
jgi:hypothetical protein